MKNLYLLLFLIIFLLSSCGGSPAAAVPTATGIQGPPTAASTELPDGPADTQESDSPSGLPADVETYYKTMVFIEGTAQLMSKFDLSALSDESTGLLALIAIPGIMDDRVIATEESPMPAGLDSAWAKALEARDGILEAYEAVLTTMSQEDFIKQLGTSESLASQAVAETEALSVSEYGATVESIAVANRAALTEMGEAYQTYVSMIQVLQAEVDHNSE